MRAEPKVIRPWQFMTLAGLSIVITLGTTLGLAALVVDLRLRPQSMVEPTVHQSGRFSYSFDPATGCPRWTAELLTLEVIAGDADRDRAFRTDKNLPPFMRRGGDDYPRIGFDRGHGAAARNYGNQADSDATFVYSNVLLEHVSVNRGSLRLVESKTRGLLRAGNKVAVVTLPVWGPTTSVHGNKKSVGVPNAVGKAVLVIEGNRPTEMLGWLIPNSEAGAKPIAELRCSVDELELRTQLDLWPWLPDNLEDRLEAASPKRPKAHQ